MYTHTHVHVTTSLAHYTHTHLGAVSHSVDDTLQQKDQGTSPSEKGTERKGWEPLEVDGELRQEEREKGIIGQTDACTHTRRTKYIATDGYTTHHQVMTCTASYSIRSSRHAHAQIYRYTAISRYLVDYIMS